MMRILSKVFETTTALEEIHQFLGELVMQRDIWAPAGGLSNFPTVAQRNIREVVVGWWPRLEVQNVK